VVTGRFDDLFHAVFAADIAGIDPQTGSTRLGGFDPAFVMEMNVRHDGYRAFAADFFKRAAAVFVGHRNAHNIGARIGSGLHLCECGFHIRSERVGHGLHRDRCPPAHGHIAHHDLAAFTAINVAPRTDRIEGHKATCQVCVTVNLMCKAPAGNGLRHFVYPNNRQNILTVCPLRALKSVIDTSNLHGTALGQATEVTVCGHISHRIGFGQVVH